MRIIALLLMCLFAACSSITIDSDDVGLYQSCRIFKPLILPKPISDMHPRLTKQLMRAITRWEMAVPVDFYVATEYFGPRGSVSVVMTDSSNPIVQYNGDPLGFFCTRRQMLYLNNIMEFDEETFSDDSIYKTCLHELGHVLGLPHIIGPDSFMSGTMHDIVLPSKEDAQACIMYPYSADSFQLDLTPIEILLARHFLLHDLNMTHSMQGCDYGRREDRDKPF